MARFRRRLRWPRPFPAPAFTSGQAIPAPVSAKPDCAGGGGDPGQRAPAGPGDLRSPVPEPVTEPVSGIRSGSRPAVRPEVAETAPAAFCG